MLTLIKKEINLCLLETRIQILLITVFSLTFVVTILDSYEYKDKFEKYLTERNSSVDNLKKNQVYATIKPKLLKKPSELSIISKGVEDDMGDCVDFDYMNIPYTAYKVNKTNDYTSEFTNLDISKVLIWLISLISIFISYDLVSRENESGTLKLNLVNKISRNSLYLSKFIAACLLIFFIITSILFIISLIYIISPWLIINYEILSRFLFLFITLFLFSLFFITAGLFFSVISKSSVQSLVFCLTLWVILTIVIPSLIKLTIGNTNFTTENKKIHASQNEIMQQYWSKNDEAWTNYLNPLINDLKFCTFGGSPGWEPVLGANPATKEAIIKYYALLNPLKEKIANTKYEIANREIIVPLKKKLKKLYTLSYLSPITSTDIILMNISNTSYEDHFKFLDDARVYRDAVLKYVQSKNGIYSTRWFTPENDYYPFSANHPLCPTNVYKLTKTELANLSKYYQGVENNSDFILDLGDFPQFKSPFRNYSDFIQDIWLYFVAICMPSIILLALGFSFMNKYNLDK